VSDFQPYHLDTLWEAELQFWRGFTPRDWSKRGSTDALNHLTALNYSFIESIRRPPDAPLPPEIGTLNEMQAWRAAQPTTRDGPQALTEYEASMFQVRDAVAGLPLEHPVYLTLLTARGWRTLRFALEFVYSYSYLHFAHSHSVRDQWLPGIPQRMTQIAVDFFREYFSPAFGEASLTLEQLVKRGAALTFTDTARGSGDTVWPPMLRGSTPPPDFR